MNEKRNDDSSRSGNDDIDNEKPLKKARYLWEVKGNHHLKERSERDDSGASSTSTAPRPTIHDNNNERIPDRNCYKINLNRSSLDDSYLSLLSNSMDAEGSVEDIPASLVPDESTEDEDYYLNRWQARQLGRAFMDNTINRVLETWLPPTDAADFLSCLCDADEDIEDEGIMMAIQSHGLRHEDATVRLEETVKDDNVDLKMDCGGDQKDFEDCGGDYADFLNAAVSVALSKKGLSSCK